jgi:hypothetical protein
MEIYGDDDRVSNEAFHERGAFQGVQASKRGSVSATKHPTGDLRPSHQFPSNADASSFFAKKPTGGRQPRWQISFLPLLFLRHKGAIGRLYPVAPQKAFSLSIHKLQGTGG